MNKLEKSLSELKQKLKENEDLSIDEWNDYACEHSLFSAITIEARMNFKNWEEVKQSFSDKRENLTRDIEKIRKKLYKSIAKYGLNAFETIELSKQIDVLISQYYKRNKDKKKGRYYKEGNFMDAMYQKSYEHLKSMIDTLDEFPTIEIWNAYAAKNNCLNSQSMEYISGLDWHKLRDRVKTSVSFKKYYKI